MTERLFLIDGNSFCYRAYYAIKSLSTATGQPTNAIYGFIVMLNKLISEFRPDYIAVAFDLKGPTFRHKRFEGYKAERKGMPDDLASQLDTIKEVIRTYKIPIYESEGFEADDCLATVAMGLAGENRTVYIVTSDKDMLQLVSDNIKVVNPQRENLIYDEAEVERQFGVEPEKMVDLLALMGDSSDNIPGVPGIGHKRALKLLNEFGSLDELLAKGELSEASEVAALSRDLAKLSCDVPLEFSLGQMRLVDPDKEALARIYKRLEFKSLLKGLGVETTKIDFRRQLAVYILGREVEGDYEEALKRESSWGLYSDIELPLERVLREMESVGVKVDLDYLRALSEEMDLRLGRSVRDIYEIAGCEFNINSHRQLREILFEKLNLPVVKKTKTGPSTDEEVLRNLSGSHALPSEILRYRSLSKLKSTYVDALIALAAPKTGRIHTSFNQMVAATGRLSSSEPNLQNIPIRTEDGKKIRRAFISSNKDYSLISADYSQIELRILAHFSGDEGLLVAFKAGRDIHRVTAGLIYGVPEDSITDEMRSRTKAVNFGIIYGMSAYGLAKDLNISPEEAAQFIEGYFYRYPKVKAWIEETVQAAREDGFVKTSLGRRRYIPELKSNDPARRALGERIAVNTPIQGSAADIIKCAMVRIHNRIKEENLEGKMVLTVHDELLFDVPKREADIFVRLAQEEMEGAFELSVPLQVDIGIGENWLEAGGK